MRELCDTATILREGRVIGRVDPRKESTQSLAQRMNRLDTAGASPGSAFRQLRERLGVAWRAQYADEAAGFGLHDIRFKVNGGEIFGIAGLPATDRQHCWQR